MLFKPIALEGGNDNPAEGMASIQPKVYAEAHALPPVRRIPSEGDIRKALQILTLRQAGRRPRR
jgi:hypothetical protein